MSWFSDAVGSGVRFLGDSRRNIYSTVGHAANDISKFYNPMGVMSAASQSANNLANFYGNEYAAKSDLRAAEIEGVLSGVPVVGDLLRGANGIQQMEDLYDRTGKTAAYAANQNLGSSSLGFGASTGPQRIADGFFDLAEYYSGGEIKDPQTKQEYGDYVY